jgi:carboxyl-terminal processing protease
MTQSPPGSWPARLTGAGLALVLVLGLVVGSYRLGERSAEPELEDAGAPALPTGFEAIGELYQRIHDEAVRPPSDEELLEGALEGMLGTVEDPYAAYYDAAAFSEFSQALEGGFSGVGLVLEETPEGLTVVSVLPDTPAERAGIEEGEQIVSVDGDDVTDLPLTAVVERVKGDEGTTVVLGLDGGEQGPRELELERAVIDLPILESELFDDGTAYLRLTSFTRGGGDQVREALTELIRQGADGVVLDLRGNPGGLLREAVEVTSVFVDEGTVVEVQERVGERQALEAAGEALTDLPLVVLVDKRTASSAEIVAGAVQDLDRGAVVGLATFGKGTVQTIRSLQNGGGFKITTAEYYTPSGDSIEGVGVTPDREVSDPDDQLLTAQQILQDQMAAATRGGRG